MRFSQRVGTAAAS